MVPRTLLRHAADEPTRSGSDRAVGQQRQRVLGLLRGEGVPVDAWRVADKLQIHITTARFHLSTLESQGVVRRAARARGDGAGRPRLTYEIAPRLDYADIVALFAAHLGGTPAEREDRAAHIGADLARRIKLDVVRAGASATDLVVDALGELGFQIRSVIDAFGEVKIEICTCPLAEIAVDSPEVVRGIQQGLIQAILDANAEPAAARYQVSVYPDSAEGSCQVSLVLRPGDRLPV